MKIFVINLLRDDARRDSMEIQLNRLSLDYEFFPAVYGKDLSKYELSQHYSDAKSKFRTGRSLVPAEIGCALSHISIYNKMIDDKVEYALILEDDVILPDNLETILDECGAFFEMVKPQVLLLSPGIGLNVIKKFSGDFYLNKYCSGFYTSSYILNLSAARALVKELYPVNDVADCWLRLKRYCVVEMYIINPSLIIQNQESFGSSTTDQIRELFINNKYFIIKFYLLRMLFKLWELIYVPYRKIFYFMKMFLYK